MKVTTAVRHLVEMADVSTERLPLRDSGIGWPLQELWVTGELLEGAESLEWGSVILVLDLPPDELTCLAKPHGRVGRLPAPAREAPLHLGLPALRLARLEPPQPPAGPLLVG